MPDSSIKFDVVVAGAGIAGIAAAVKAAREGLSVLLVERYGFAGGSASAGMVSPFMNHKINNEPLVRGIFSEIQNKMIAMKGMIDNGFSAVAFRTAVYELLRESGVRTMFLSQITKVYRQDRLIKAVEIQNADFKYKVSAEIFIDTSGDAQLIFLAGLPWAKGDEQTGNLQSMTLFFSMAQINTDRLFDYVKKNPDNFMSWMKSDFDISKIISVAGFYREVQEAHQKGILDGSVEYIFFTTLPEQGEASFNSTNILSLDGSSSIDLTNAEIYGRRQVWQIVNLLHSKVPGFENSVLSETATQVGIRETRRAIGNYVFSGKDVKSGAKFKDAIARGCYGIDIHGQKNEQNRMEHLDENVYYEIPLRSLVVKDAENVFAAGRCISSTREGHSAIRIMPTSAATGEACGAAAAVCVKNKYLTKDIDYRQLKSLIPHNLS